MIYSPKLFTPSLSFRETVHIKHWTAGKGSPRMGIDTHQHVWGKLWPCKLYFSCHSICQVRNSHWCILKMYWVRPIVAIPEPRGVNEDVQYFLKADYRVSHWSTRRFPGYLRVIASTILRQLFIYFNHTCNTARQTHPLHQQRKNTQNQTGKAVLQLCYCISVCIHCVIIRLY